MNLIVKCYQEIHNRENIITINSHNLIVSLAQILHFFEAVLWGEEPQKNVMDSLVKELLLNSIPTIPFSKVRLLFEHAENSNFFRGYFQSAEKTCIFIVLLSLLKPPHLNHSP